MVVFQLLGFNLCINKLTVGAVDLSAVTSPVAYESLQPRNREPNVYARLHRTARR